MCTELTQVTPVRIEREWREAFLHFQIAKKRSELSRVSVRYLHTVIMCAYIPFSK